jgi:hypothetical protein
MAHLAGRPGHGARVARMLSSTNPTAPRVRAIDARNDFPDEKLRKGELLQDTFRRCGQRLQQGD